MNKNSKTTNVEKILLDITNKYNKFWENIRKEYKFKEGDFHFKILQGYIEVRARKYKKVN